MDRPGIDLNSTTNRVIAAIILLVVFIGGWWLISRNAVGIGGKTATSTGATTTSGAKGGSGSPSADSSGAAATMQPVGGENVQVGDQPAGSFVMVTSATLSNMGWVAVRDAGGRVLGAARLEAGTHEAVQVELLRNTVTGEKYQVLLYADDGDKVFDLHKDTLVTNADGSIEGASFNALFGD